MNTQMEVMLDYYDCNTLNENGKDQLIKLLRFEISELIKQNDDFRARIKTI